MKVLYEDNHIIVVEKEPNIPSQADKTGDIDILTMVKQYIKERKIQKGSIFVTKNGQPLDRSNIFREMKSLCEEAGVDREKVFPHNLRHLFACTYYQKEKDISHLADLLGHSSVDTTRIYLVKSSEEQEQQMECLGLVI